MARFMFALAALVLTSPAPVAQPEPVVHIANFTFGPQAIPIHSGQTVTWVNDDDVPHSVVAVDKSFRSKILDTGDRFSFTFARPGEFAYFCSLHTHMTGTVVVTG